MQQKLRAMAEFWTVGWTQGSRCPSSLRPVSTHQMIHPTAKTITSFKPCSISPASLMCKGMSFSVSLFYHNAPLSPSVMASALQHLANEAPILAARTTVPAIFPRIFRRFSDVEVVLQHARPSSSSTTDDSTGGFSFRTDSRQQSLRHVIDMIWKDKTPLVLHERRKMPQTIEPINAGKTDADELAHVDLVRYNDGSVLTLHISHLLADAARAIKLLERLSAIYEAIDANKPVPPARVTFDTWHTKVVATPATPSSPPSSLSELLRLRPSHLLDLPVALYDYVTTKFAPVYIYVPRDAVTALQGKSNCSKGHSASHDDSCDDTPSISKMDIVQALAVTLLRRARPDHPADSVIINMDLSRVLSPTDDVDTVDTLGNASDFLQIHAPFHPANVTYNARRIREALEAYRSEARENVQRALRTTAAMSRLPKPAVRAAFIVHGRREKLASCTAVASFPTDGVRFAGTKPSFHSINSHVGFDWWSIVTSVTPSPICPDMDGWIISINAPQGDGIGDALADLQGSGDVQVNVTDKDTMADGIFRHLIVL